MSLRIKKTNVADFYGTGLDMDDDQQFLIQVYQIELDLLSLKFGDFSEQATLHAEHALLRSVPFTVTVLQT